MNEPPIVLLSHWPGYEPYEVERSALEATGAQLILAEGAFEAVEPHRRRSAVGLINFGWALQRSTIEELDTCRIIAHGGIGVDGIDLVAATERGIIVTNVPYPTVDEVANHTIALLLALSRKVLFLDQAVRAGRWDDQLLKPAYKIRGKMLGLIGFGNIGQSVAVKMQAFGMQTIAYDPYLSPDLATLRNTRLVTLSELLAEADFVCVLAPLTAETQYLLGRAELQSMKRSAFLVVTSRGPIVDQDALYRALAEGWIAGAGVDVLERAPLSPTDPLLRLDNLIVTPNVAGYSEEGFQRVHEIVTQAVIDVLAGSWPSFVVNPGVRERSRLTGLLHGRTV